MATWDDMKMYGYSIRDVGLKTCPFDSSHKMKASKYCQHITKCEQRFPNSGSLIAQSGQSTLSLNSERMSSVVSYFESVSNDSDINDITKSMNQLTTSDDCSATESPPLPVPSTSGSCNGSFSSDSAIGLTTNGNSVEDNSDTDLKISAQTSSVTTIQPNEGNSGDIEQRSAEPILPIVPQQVTAVPEPTNDSTDVDNGSGDNDNEWKSGQKEFSLYEGFDNFDDLSEDQIMEMGNSFIDVVLLSKMTKTQRKQINDKLIQLRKSEKELKKKAFNELVTFQDVFDPQLKDIPQEIRKPRIDVRDLFNLNKRQNKRIDTVMSATPLNPEPKELRTPAISEPREVCPQISGDCCAKSLGNELADSHELKTVCNSCLDPLAINEENIKRVTIFCAKCSGVKFGGYFECHSCKMYGYFANSQITQHLDKHFPKNN